MEGIQELADLLTVLSFGMKGNTIMSTTNATYDASTYANGWIWIEAHGGDIPITKSNVDGSDSWNLTLYKGERLCGKINSITLGTVPSGAYISGYKR